MAVKERSFWSSTSGVVTGIAGTVTGIVALVTMATQLGVVGSSGDGQSATSDGETTTTSVGAGSSSLAERGAGAGSIARGGRSQTTGTPEFTVEPRSVSFDSLGERTATVKVVNDGTAPIDLDAPTVEGSDADAFSVSAPSCSQGSLDPGRSCEVEVTFSPKHNGDSDAELVIEADGSEPQEVTLSGKALL